MSQGALHPTDQIVREMGPVKDRSRTSPSRFPLTGRRILYNSLSRSKQASRVRRQGRRDVYCSLQIEPQRRMLTKPPGNIPRQNGGSMSRRRITTISLISASLLIAVSGCLLWATTSSGSTSVLLGRATYKPEHGDVLQVQRVLPPSWSA